VEKKAKSRKASSKRASEDTFRAALSILEEMIKSGKQVHVMVVGGPFILTFEAAVEKHDVECWYAITAEGFNISVAPAMSKTILFSSDGGLLFNSKSMAMTIEPEEHSAEELVARFPEDSKLIN
jgi:hypothetical protein